MVLTCRKLYDKDHDEDLRKKKTGFPFYEGFQTNQSAVRIKSKRSLNCRSFNKRQTVRANCLAIKPARHVIPPPSSHTLLFLYPTIFFFSYDGEINRLTRIFLFLLNNNMLRLLPMAKDTYFPCC